jgi:Rrf2 family protein
VKISTRGRYGTRILLDLALSGEKGPVPLKDIARRQEIPLLYLERLVSPLKAAGLLRIARGAKGGAVLLKPPGEIKLSTIIQLMEGTISPVECVTDPSVCSRSNSCFTRDVWNELKEAMDGVLESKTLQDLADGQRKKDHSEEAMYYI